MQCKARHRYGMGLPGGHYWDYHGVLSYAAGIKIDLDITELQRLDYMRGYQDR